MGNKGDISYNGRARSDLPPTYPVAAHLTSKPRQKRAGPGNPGKRATTAEVEERIVAVARMLTTRLHKHQIKQYLANKFDLGARSSEAYIARARKWLIQQLEKPRENFVAEAVGFYEDIIRAPDSSLRHKMDAQMALRQMLGLDTPFKCTPMSRDTESCIPRELIANATLAELGILHSLHLRAQSSRALSDGRVAD